VSLSASRRTTVPGRGQLPCGGAAGASCPDYKIVGVRCRCMELMLLL
jgi:hypothetical protein